MVVKNIRPKSDGKIVLFHEGIGIIIVIVGSLTNEWYKGNNSYSGYAV